MHGGVPTRSSQPARANALVAKAVSSIMKWLGSQSISISDPSIPSKPNRTRERAIAHMHAYASPRHCICRPTAPSHLSTPKPTDHNSKTGTKRLHQLETRQSTNRPWPADRRRPRGGAIHTQHSAKQPAPPPPPPQASERAGSHGVVRCAGVCGQRTGGCV